MKENYRPIFIINIEKNTFLQTCLTHLKNNLPCSIWHWQYRDALIHEKW